MSDPQPPAPKRVPLGPPLDWSEDELTALAEVSASDLEEAKGWVGKNADARGKALWEAQPEDAASQE